jgi:hypothetical protein
MTACAFPATSRLSAQLGRAHYHDAYEAPLRRPELTIAQLYVAILGHLPWWARTLIIARNSVVAPFGLRTAPIARVWQPEIKDRYEPGDRIVRFVLYSQDGDEIVAGGDDKHLDFRVSVLRLRDDTEKVVVSTIIFVHNAFGRAYLRAVLPFHKRGVAYLLAVATAQGRI